MPPGNDPFAAYGGAALGAPPPDPFTAYGGAAISAPKPPGPAVRRNAMAQPGITPEMRAASPINQDVVTGLKAAPVVAAASGAAAATPWLTSLLPSFAAASEKFEQVKDAVGDHTVGMTDELSDATQRISQLAKSGLQMPKVVGDFIDRTINTEKYPEGAPTFNEIRDFYSTAVSKLSPEEIMKMTPRMQAALGQWTQSLGNALNDVADQGGVLGKYRDAMSEWKGASTISDFTDKAIELGKKAAITTGVGALLGAGGSAAYRTLQELGIVK